MVGRSVEGTTFLCSCLIRKLLLRFLSVRLALLHPSNRLVTTLHLRHCSSNPSSSEIVDSPTNSALGGKNLVFLSLTVTRWCCTGRISIMQIKSCIRRAEIENVQTLLRPSPTVSFPQQNIPHGDIHLTTRAWRRPEFGRETRKPNPPI